MIKEWIIFFDEGNYFFVVNGIVFKYLVGIVYIGFFFNNCYFLWVGGFCGWIYFFVGIKMDIVVIVGVVVFV